MSFNKNQLVQYANKWGNNIAFIFIFTFTSILIALQVNLPDSSNHGGLIAIIYPLFIGLTTIIVYLLSRIFIKKYNWILSILGGIWSLSFLINWCLQAS